MEYECRCVLWIIKRFYFKFNDADNNNIVSSADVVFFSGMTYTYSGGKIFYYQLLLCPDRTIDGGLTLINPSSGVQAYWAFHGSSGDIYPGDTSWGYTVTPQVPIPAAVWLLGSGLIGIVGLRRKFKT